MLPKINRLTRESDFELVFKKGKSLKEEFLILRFVPNKIKSCRFGIVISKKISNKAVWRNKMKRRMTALLKTKIGKIKESVDVVFIALPGFATKNFLQIEEVVNNLFKKARLI